MPCDKAISATELPALSTCLGFADCDIGEESAQGQTALMFESLFNRQEVVSSLIEKGANRKHVDKAGNSEADIAFSQSNHALAEALKKDNK